MTQPTSSSPSRLGFHYYPDTLHYRQSDLTAWLPRLAAVGARWLLLVAPLDRAIPEPFLRGLLDAGIEPVLHFPAALLTPPTPESLQLLLDSYARWGVRYVIFFDRPNLRSAWSAAHWAQEDLVERFLDRYLPLAEQAAQAGLQPVFPPLQPGGDYWDTAFLRSALVSLRRRQSANLVDHLVLSAYAPTHDRPLNWGAGGPERWPGARPYATPAGEEDQRGVRIGEWYAAIAEAALGQTRPVLLLGLAQTLPADLVAHAQLVEALANLLAGQPAAEPCQPDQPLEPFGAAILGGLFSDLPGFFTPEAQRSLPAVERLRALQANRQPQPVETAVTRFPIAHYLLLPTYDWGVADWHLEAARPFIKKHQPTVGFSLREAAQAARVTVIGGDDFYSEESLSRLRAQGSWVERIEGDGTTIASILAER